MKQVKVVIDSRCSKEDIKQLQEVRKELKRHLDEVTQAMEVINEVITFKNLEYSHHPATAMTRVSPIKWTISSMNHTPQITATFFAKGLIDNKLSIIEASTFATWNGWLDFGSLGIFGDFGNGTSKAAYALDIYRSTRFN